MVSGAYKNPGKKNVYGSISSNQLFFEWGWGGEVFSKGISLSDDILRSYERSDAIIDTLASFLFKEQFNCCY